MEPKLEAKKPKEERNIAFKAWKPRTRVVESSDSDGDDVEAIIKQFTKALMKKMGKSSGKNVKEKGGPKCYRCNEYGHIKPDCPLLKNKDNGGEASKGKRKGESKIFKRDGSRMEC